MLEVVSAEEAKKWEKCVLPKFDSGGGSAHLSQFVLPVLQCFCLQRMPDGSPVAPLPWERSLNADVQSQGENLSQQWGVIVLLEA